MPTFEIECVDTTTFKVYTTSVTAASVAEARQEVVRNGHKLATPGQSLNPQLVPPSVQLKIPEAGDEETPGIPRSDQERSSNIRMMIFLAIVIIVAGIILAMRMLR